MHFEAGIFATLNEEFGRFVYIFQEDNAPVHTGVSRMIVAQCRMPNWPVKSPDLNLIEQIWASINDPLRGRHFEDDDEHFDAIQSEWDQMDPTWWQMMCPHSMPGASFVPDWGISLSGHWKEMHQEHHPEEELTQQA
jgi:hypothetical protein